jgi:hypothetical protein
MNGLCQEIVSCPRGTCADVKTVIFSVVLSTGAQDTKSRGRHQVVAGLVVFVLILAGCGKLDVRSQTDGLQATSGTTTTIYWTFFNQDFKDFAAGRVSTGATREAVYDIATASHPGIKFFRISHGISEASVTTGSGVEKTVLLRTAELRNQGDGVSLSSTETISFTAPAFGFDWLAGGRSTTLGADFDPADLCGLFVMASNQDFLNEDQQFYTSVGQTSDVYSCSEPAGNEPGGYSGSPGIFLAVNPALLGRPVEGAPIYSGAESIKPNSTYTLSIQSVKNPVLTRTVLDSGIVNARGHLYVRVLLGALNPGSYKIVMTGIHPSGYPLVLTNYITVGANGSIVSVSAESQQPFLN